MTGGKQHLPWLDWLRFLAALNVVMAHARGTAFVAYGDLAEGSRNGITFLAFLATRTEHEAVIVFFVLSGFLVGGKAASRMHSGTFRSSDYIIDRVSRIVVPLIPALLLTWCLAPASGQSAGIGGFFGNLLGLQGIVVPVFGGNDPLWSLAYEYWFYILVVAIAGLVMPSRIQFWALGLTAVVMGVFTKLEAVYLFSWLIGAAAWVRRPARASWGVMVLAVVLVGAGVGGIQLVQSSEVDKGPLAGTLEAVLPARGIWVLVLSVGIAVLIQQLILLQSTKTPVVRFERFGTWLAGFSYTLYLTHFPILRFVSQFGYERAPAVSFSSVFGYLGICLLCFVVAWVLYLPFEKQTKSIRRWMRGRLASP